MHTPANRPIPAIVANDHVGQTVSAHYPQGPVRTALTGNGPSFNGLRKNYVWHGAR